MHSASPKVIVNKSPVEVFLWNWAGFGPAGKFRVHEYLVIFLVEFSVFFVFFLKLQLCADPNLNVVGGTN